MIFKKQSAFIGILAFVTSSAALAGNAELIWKCEGQSDPDFAHVSIYKMSGKLVATIYQESGDGDKGAEDLIEVVRSDDGNDSRFKFVQVDGSAPKAPALVKKPSRKTKGAEISIPISKNDDGSALGESGPTGDELNEHFLSCESAK